ncbi:hypothetical protein KCTC52924_00323 [Arenibacter antarcticus]
MIFVKNLAAYHGCRNLEDFWNLKIEGLINMAGVGNSKRCFRQVGLDEILAANGVFI